MTKKRSEVEKGVEAILDSFTHNDARQLILTLARARVPLSADQKLRGALSEFAYMAAYSLTDKQKESRILEDKFYSTIDLGFPRIAEQMAKAALNKKLIDFAQHVRALPQLDFSIIGSLNQFYFNIRYSQGKSIPQAYLEIASAFTKDENQTVRTGAEAIVKALREYRSSPIDNTGMIKYNPQN